MPLLTRPPTSPDDEFGYPSHEEAADRKAARHDARHWSPVDPRIPEPPPRVRVICEEVFAQVLKEYESHHSSVAHLAEQVVGARARLAAAEADAERRATGKNAADDGSPDGPHTEFADFDKIRKEQLRRADDADRDARDAAWRHQLVEAEATLAELDVRYRAAVEHYRIRFAEHTVKGRRRIRTVTSVLLTHHRLREQMPTLDDRCLHELRETIRQFGDQRPPEQFDLLPTGPRDEE